MRGSGFLNDIKSLSNNFGIGYAYKFRIKPYVMSKITHKKYSYYYNVELSCYLKDCFLPIIDRYKELECNHQKDVIAPDAPIWVCWWQGEDNMPPIIKQCYKLLCENANGHPIKLITSQNVKSFVEIPSYIYKKLSDGNITITHFTDILRVSLLAKHGGLWIDATFWVTQPLQISNEQFFSLKQEPIECGLISDFRWIGGCEGGPSSLFVFPFIRDCLYHYWNTHDYLIQYFLLDYIFDIAYNEFSSFKQIIDSYPYRCPQLHIMKQKFNNEFEENVMAEILEKNPILSLTWKKQFDFKTAEGKETNFSYFMSL